MNNVQIKFNNAGTGGGGIYIYANSSLIGNDLIIDNNTSFKCILNFSINLTVTKNIRADGPAP